MAETNWDQVQLQVSEGGCAPGWITTALSTAVKRLSMQTKKLRTLVNVQKDGKSTKCWKYTELCV